MLAFFGNIRLEEFATLRVQDYIDARRKAPGIRAGTTLSNATIRNELHSLSNLLSRAVADEHIASNAVRRLHSRPAAPPPRGEFLERDEAARLLDCAHELDQEARVACEIVALKSRADALGDARKSPEARALNASARDLYLRAGLAAIHHTYEPILEALLAVFLYTGMRHEEVLGLLVEDVDFTNNWIHVRPNSYRGLKRTWHIRRLTMWPGLRAILLRYLEESDRTTGLLFPGKNRAGEEIIRYSIAKQVNRLLVRARMDDRNISPHTFRHTFTAMLLLTVVVTDGGTKAIRNTFEVAQALGHTSDALVRKIYGHVASRSARMDSLDYEAVRLYPSI
jgi:integrase